MPGARRTSKPGRGTYERLYVDQGMTIHEVAAELGIPWATVRRDMLAYSIELRSNRQGQKPWANIASRTEDTYRRLYVDGEMSLRQVANELGVSTDVVMKDMRKLGVATRALSPTTNEYKEREALYSDVSCSGMDILPDRQFPPVDRKTSQKVRYRDLDTSFFSSIDSDIKAYALGFLWTDGSIDTVNPRVRLTLQEEDAPALEAIREAMRAAPLQWHPPQPGHGVKPTVQLHVCSRQIIDDLRHLGLRSNKSEFLPGVVPPPRELETAFVRGCIDGDGSLYRPSYPTICFYNQNPHLRAIVSACWERITGKHPPTYASITEGKPRPRLCEIGHRALAIASELYLVDPNAVALPRKRARAGEYQNWRRTAG